MKLTELMLFRESPFTPRNFPDQPNKKFAGAGERTVYAEMPVNQPNGAGFRVMKQTKVTRGQDGITELKPNTRIFWTSPAKLFTAAEIGEKGTSNYAAFGLTGSSAQEAVGLIPISTVEKPSQVAKRVLTGKAGQEEVLHYLVNTYSDSFRTIDQVSSAGIGSTKADLIVSFDDTPIQFEIKNSTSPSAPLTLFDKTVRRDKPNAIIDGLTAIMTGRSHATLAKLIDQARQKDKTIGFPGDKGVGKSGKFILRIDNTHDLIGPAHDYIEDHFASHKDNYLAINYGGGNVRLYYTGYGANTLDAEQLPIPKYIDLRTYGGPTAGGMRMGVKIKL